MKVITLAILIGLLSISIVAAPPLPGGALSARVIDTYPITGAGEAYGHHGNCHGWNGCGDAATCAQWACEVNGFDYLVSHGADAPCDQLNMCHLFRSQGDIDWNWGNSCGVSGVTDIVCSYVDPGNGGPGPDNNVPEFGILGATLGLIIAGIFVLRRRK